MSLAEEFADFVGSVPYRAVELPWGRAQVWDLGVGEPVVLLHGIASSRRVFFRIAPLLAERARVIVPPLRGEDRPFRCLTWEELTGDLAALLDALELDGVTLLGFSFGGALALAYGGLCDPRVRRIVVQGAFARFRLRPFDRAVLTLSHTLPAALGSRYFAYRVLRGAESRLLARVEPGLEVLNADWSRKTPFATLRARTRLVAREDLAPQIARIDVPLTFVRGTLDKVVPRALFERLCALRPDARRVEWQGTGHLAALTNPLRFVSGTILQ